jgi:antitoxin MazE
MRTRIIRIGNSQGVRIPKLLLEQSGLAEEVELEVRSDHIVIRAAAPPRATWGQAFAAMAEAGDDALLDSDVLPAAWDDREWTW